MPKQALVIGGAGALGKTLVNMLTTHLWSVVSIDISNEGKNVSHGPLPTQIWLDPNQASSKAVEFIGSTLAKIEISHFDAIYCVAGGFSMSNAQSTELFDAATKLWKMNVESSLLGVGLAGKHLTEGGLFVLTGAAAALAPTPAMLGYGLTKAAVHHLAKSLADSRAGLPLNTRVVTVLPMILDTPGNRAAMPGAHTADWTPLETLVEKLVAWGNDTEGVSNGDFIKVETKEGTTRFTKLTC